VLFPACTGNCAIAESDHLQLFCAIKSCFNGHHRSSLVSSTIFCFFQEKMKKKKEEEAKKGKEIASGFPRDRPASMPVPAHVISCARTSLVVMCN
jgi:hypothetical protein